MNLIGKGLFSRVYLNDDNETVKIMSCCYAKECLALFGYGDSRLWPKLERVDSDEYSEYRGKYYPRVSGLKRNLCADDWKIYQTLRNLPTFGKDYYGLYEVFSTIEDESLQETMLQALDALADYGSDMAFEISPRNVAIDGDKLILLDVFFFKSQLKSLRKGVK
jgi:hypothetical protein